MKQHHLGATNWPAPQQVGSVSCYQWLLVMLAMHSLQVYQLYAFEYQ